MALVDASVWIEWARRRGDLACRVGLEALLDTFEATLALELGCGAYAWDGLLEQMSDALDLRLCGPGHGGAFNPDRAG